MSGLTRLASEEPAETLRPWHELPFLSSSSGQTVPPDKPLPSVLTGELGTCLWDSLSKPAAHLCFIRKIKPPSISPADVAPSLAIQIAAASSDLC